MPPLHTAVAVPKVVPCSLMILVNVQLELQKTHKPDGFSAVVPWKY